MTIIASDCVINMEQVQLIHMENGDLVFDVIDGAISLTNCPENALPQIAMAIAQDKKFLEMEDAKLVVTGGTNED